MEVGWRRGLGRAGYCSRGGVFWLTLPGKGIFESSFFWWGQHDIFLLHSCSLFPGNPNVHQILKQGVQSFWLCLQWKEVWWIFQIRGLPRGRRARRHSPENWQQSSWKAPTIYRKRGKLWQRQSIFEVLTLTFVHFCILALLSAK